MATKWLLVLLVTALVVQFGDAFIVPRDPECYSSDNDTSGPKEKCSWLLKVERNLGKYRNFYAYLLQEENKEFALELQELYNTICMALNERDLQKRRVMLLYSKWLIESTKNLEDFLLDKGIMKV